MRLLITTQALDSQNPALGFFVRWVEEFSKHVEHIEVIALKVGAHKLPRNVMVHSLGKERRELESRGRIISRIRYSMRLMRLAWSLRKKYDSVLVHMNEEHLIVAGWLWKLLGKRVFMWRNHYQGSWRTDIASSFCQNVFCTSHHSYTAKYRKTVFMPVGVDTDYFNRNESTVRIPRSVLFLARMAPSKNPQVVVDAISLLRAVGLDVTATIIGSPLPQDESFYRELKLYVERLGLMTHVKFIPSVPNAATPDWYRQHEFFINASRSGMFDKTLFEAAACGALVIASSLDFKELAGEKFYFDGTAEHLALVLASHIEAGEETRETFREKYAYIVERNGLSRLGVEIIACMR